MADDLFRPAERSSYPKMEDLEGSLLLVRPTKCENVPGYQGKGTVDRITADVTVLGPDGAEFYEDMYLSQAGFVSSCKKALKPGAVPMVLGRVMKYPSKVSKANGIETPEALELALAKWVKAGGKGTKPEFGWGLGEYSVEDAQTARDWIASTQPADPFASDE